MSSFDAIKDLYEEKRRFSSRVVIGALIFVLMIGLLLLRLSSLQLIQHNYYTTRANDNRMRVVAQPPVRGLIYDRNGVLLAQNRPSFNLEVTREQVKDLKTLLAQLTPIFNLSEGDIARFKDRLGKTPHYRGVPLKTNLSQEDVAKFEINRFRFHGVDISSGLTRNYPLGGTASHIVGYVGGISMTDYANLDENLYQGISLIGKMGVEKSHEDDLRGVPGASIVEADAAGRPLRELETRDGKPGLNLYLSIDSKLQEVAEKALGDLNGAVVAIDPQTGELLAMVSKPGFDPAMFVDGISTKNYRALQSDPGKPLYNRALQGTYPPGSTIKPFMTFAGLLFDETSPSSHTYCSGAYSLPNSSRKYRCWRRSGHGTLNMENALARSCDIFYYQLAMALGIDRISSTMAQFGFGHATGLDIPNERNGLSPSREWKERVRKEVWFPGETLNIGIGQGYWQVTPLQMAQATARLAMRGGGFKPHLVHAMEDQITGTVTGVVPEALPQIGSKDPSVYNTVISAMELVTHQPGGTAYRIGKSAPYRIASKTGTAQVAGLSQSDRVARSFESTPRHLRDHAWFIAFAPADQARIAVAVIAENAGHGGSIAAPVARQVMDQYLLGKVLFATEALAATPTEVLAPGAAPVTSDNPADAVDAANPESGFIVPGQPLPTDADAPGQPETEEEDVVPPAPVVPPTTPAATPAPGTPPRIVR